ncbi:hypothetical protein HN960_05395 [Candidatus Peregrinibacteria bacterium]|jgi:hypothetical protein|nr:hypothetical protein [Candidatus Peregrinibacteria bacterium]MBT7009837.1 hypothetical protein [Candidatus Peregrinibacteria bacterium]
MNDIMMWYVQQSMEEYLECFEEPTKSNMLEHHKKTNYEDVSKDVLLRALELAVVDVG